MRTFSHCILTLLLAAAAQAQSLNISGTIVDSAGTPVAGASVQLEKGGATAVSGNDGKFTLAGAVGIAPAENPLAPRARLHSGRLFIEMPAAGRVSVSAFGLDGTLLERVERVFETGSYGMQPPGRGAGVRFFVVEAGGHSAVVHGVSLDGALHPAPAASGARAALAKSAAGELYDVIVASKSGYHKSYLSISKSEMTGVTVKLLKTTSPKFSFFVTSMRGLQELAANEKGFGGDLRYGETGPGAGLRGADKICATLAEKSMPGASFKGWRAFLSVTADAYGKQANAIDRIGPGPWYDRLGRVLAPNVADLKALRPKNGDPTIQNDFPNETGAFNHFSGPNGEQEDNHHTITGSDTLGRLKSATATCKDWTTADGSAANGKPSAGFCWPRFTGGGGGGGFPGGGGAIGCCHWMSTWDVAGCAPGIDIDGKSLGGNPGDNFIGSGGGYGGFYCFALSP